MKNTLTLLALMITSLIANSQAIYSKAYGNPDDKPLIYLHGGPGYHSVGFEVTTAQKLAKNGFYVITYDRRGEGRSVDKNAKFTFSETFSDLDTIMSHFNLTSSTLIGHSFGGIIATLYAEKYPEKVKSVILVSTPLSMQATYSTIIETSKSIYTNKKDSINLNYIYMLEQMDKSSLEYSSYSFAHAMQNGFYYPKTPTKEALAIYNSYRTDSIALKFGSQMSYEAPSGFWKNEKYTSIDLEAAIMKVQTNNIPIFGLYGKEDGLFSETQVKGIEQLISTDHLNYLINCSHNVFMDQQTIFINALLKWTSL